VSNKKLQRRLSHGAQHVPAAVRILDELRRAMEDGKPLAVQMAHLDELRGELLGLEDAVGVHTPPALFDAGA
jgi:hypothetical protein